MTVRMTLAAAGLLIGSLAGCDRTEGDAQRAIDRADRMVTAMKDRAMKVVPAETNALVDSLQAAKGSFAAKDHKAALATALAVQNKAIQIANSLSGKSTELSSAFMAFSGELNAAVERIKRRLSQLSRGPLPGDIDRAAFDALQTDIPTWEETWKAATREFQSGDFGVATARADSLKQKIAAANTLLGIKAVAPS